MHELSDPVSKIISYTVCTFSCDDLRGMSIFLRWIIRKHEFSEIWGVCDLWMIPKHVNTRSWKEEKFRLQTQSNSLIIFQWRRQFALNALGCQKSTRRIETEEIMFEPRRHGIREMRVKLKTAYGTHKNLTSLRYRRILRTWDESRKLC